MADTSATTAAATAAALTAAVVTASLGKMGGGGGGSGGPGGGGGRGGGARGGGGMNIQDSLARQLTRENGQNASLGIPSFTSPPPYYKNCFAKKTHYFCMSIPRTMFVAAARSFSDFDVRGDHKELPLKFEIALSLLGLIIERFAQATYVPDSEGDAGLTKRHAQVRVFMECVHAKPSTEKKDWCVEGRNGARGDDDTDIDEEEKERRSRRRARQLGKSKSDQAKSGVPEAVTALLDKFLEDSVKQTLQGSQTEMVHKYDPDKIVLFRIHVLCVDSTMKDTHGISRLLTYAVPEFASSRAFVPAPVPAPAPADEPHNKEKGSAADDPPPGKKDDGSGDEPKAKAPRRSMASIRAAAGGAHFPYHRVIGSREDIIKTLGPVAMLAPHDKRQVVLEQFIRWVFSPEIACAVEQDNVCEAQADVRNYTERHEFPIPNLVAEINDISCFYPRRLGNMQWWHLCTGLQPNPSEKQQYASLVKSGSEILVPYLIDMRDRERKEICQRVKRFRMQAPSERLEHAIGMDFELFRHVWNTPESIFGHITKQGLGRGGGRKKSDDKHAKAPPARFTAEEEDEALRAEQEAEGGLPENPGGGGGDGEAKARPPPPPSPAVRYQYPDGSDVPEEVPDATWALRTYFKLFKTTEDEKKSLPAEEQELIRKQLDDFKRYHHERYIREAGARVHGSSEATFDSLKKIDAEKLSHIEDSIKKYATKSLPEFVALSGIREAVSADLERYYVNRYRAWLSIDYKEKALRVFNDILYRDGKLSPASRAVVNWGMQYLNDPRNTYKNFSRAHSHVLPPTEKNEGMSAWASFVVGKMREFEHVLEVCKTHSTCLLAWLSCLHVHADTPFHPNLLLDGEYSSGKSFVMMLMMRLLIPGVVKDIAWMTGKALAVEGDFNDEVHLHQEVHPAMLGIGKSRDSLDPQTSSVKNAMTSGKHEVKSLVIDQVTGKRSQVTTHTQCSTVYIVALNLKEGFKLHEIPPAVRSRYAMFFIERMGKEALDLMIRSNCFQGPRFDAVVTNFHRVHYLVWYILKLEWTGVIRIHMDAANHFLHRTLSLAAKNDVTTASEKRNSERLLFLCKVCTVLSAITKYFDLPGSPISKKPWQPRDILGIEPFLVCDVEITAFVQKLNAFQFEHPHRHTVIEALRRSRFPDRKLSEYFKKDEEGETEIDHRPWETAAAASNNNNKGEKQRPIEKALLTKEDKAREAAERDISKHRKELYVYADMVPTQGRRRRNRGNGAYGDKEDRNYQPDEPDRRRLYHGHHDNIKLLTVVLAQSITVSTKEISDVLHQLYNELIPIELGTIDGMVVWTPARALDFEHGQLKCATRMFETACTESRLDASIRAVLENQFRVPRRLISGKLEKGTYHIFRTESYAGTPGEIRRTNTKYMVPALNTALSLSMPGGEDASTSTDGKNQAIIIKSDIDDYEARRHLELAGWCDPDVFIGYVGPGISPVPTEYLVHLNAYTKDDLIKKGIDLGDYPDVDLQQLAERREFAKKTEEAQMKLAEEAIASSRRGGGGRDTLSSSAPSSSSSVKTRPCIARRDSDVSSVAFQTKRRQEQEEMTTGRVSAEKRRRLNSVFMSRPESGAGEHAFVYAASSSSPSAVAASSARRPIPAAARDASLATEWHEDT